MSASDDVTGAKFFVLTVPLSRVRGLATTERVVLGLICAIPLLFSYPQLSDPLGGSEEGVNAAIWALGGRNILREGPVDALFGAKVLPYKGMGQGIYAHHPPLPVWLSALCLALGSWEGFPRVMALLAAMVALRLLYDCLRHFFEELPALVGVAAAAMTPYVLENARMLTTLTVAAPLVLLLLREALRADQRPVSSRWLFYLAIPIAVFSSWDGVLGAGAVILWRAGKDVSLWRMGTIPGRAAVARALVPAAVGLLSLGVLAAYFINASGGLDLLLGQAKYRAGVAIPWPDFLRQEGRYLVHGLGAIPLLCVLALGPWAVWGGREGRALLLVVLVSAVPSLGMTLLFRNGAFYHSFWSYNAFAPAAFGVALVASRVLQTPWRVVGAVTLTAQMLWSFSGAAAVRVADESANTVGELVKRYFGPSRVEEVAMFSAWDFHPHVTYYLDVATDVAITPAAVQDRVSRGKWTPEEKVLADSGFLRDLKCGSVRIETQSQDRRWVITSAESILQACEKPH